jgi:hypothetical protein
MGLFSWLNPKPSKVIEVDRVWLTKTAKLAGLAAETTSSARPVLILAHFPETLREVQEAFAAVKIPAETIEGQLTASDYRQRIAEPSPRAFFGLVSQLRTEPPADESEPPVPIFVAERHFLRSHDDEVWQFADGLGSPAGIVFFLALDEALMRAFAGEWVTDILRRLGLKETEAIESPMILRRVKGAQAKYASNARGDGPADSADDWLQRNGG